MRPSIQRPAGSSVRVTRRSRSWPLLVVLVLLCTPALSGCLERSTTVGDRYSGSVVVATSPDNPRGAPRLDIPESMASSITVTDYHQDSDTSGSSSPSGSATTGSPGAPPAGSGSPKALIGSRASFDNLTAGQFGQLGSIVASAFGDSSMTMDLTAKRSGDVVRFRGSADLTDIAVNRDYLKLSVAFAGPITATNGDQTSDTSVSWTPDPGKPADFSADASYTDPSTAAFGGWTWLTALLCAVAVALVVWLAWSRRDRGPRPGRPPGFEPGSPIRTVRTAFAAVRSPGRGTANDTDASTDSAYSVREDGTTSGPGSSESRISSSRAPRPGAAESEASGSTPASDGRGDTTGTVHKP